MKTLMLFLLLITPKPSPETTYVWLCTGVNYHVYHKTILCKELFSCKGSLIRVSLTDAVRRYRRTPCPFCSNNRKGNKKSTGNRHVD